MDRHVTYNIVCTTTTTTTTITHTTTTHPPTHPPTTRCLCSSVACLCNLCTNSGGYHSSPKGVWPDATHNAPRGQKSASSGGVRPAALREPVPQLLMEHAACPCSSGVPSLSLPVLADRAAEVVDSSSLRFLTANALEPRREEEEEMKRREKQEELNSRGFQVIAGLDQRDSFWREGRRHHPCRCAEAHPHGFADHGDSTVAVLGQGDRCPWYAGRAGSSKSCTRCVQRQVPSAAAVHQQGRLHSVSR